jgi:Zn-dependent peptidase ImmA (M78 family)
MRGDRIFRDQISKKVEELLRKFDIRRPPVHVDRLAKKLDLLLVPLPADDEISGAIIRKDGRVVIAVNPAHHPNRQRFTVAHELGHYFLHEKLAQHVDQNFRVAWRNADSSKAINWMEIQANRFAAELLMPTRFMLDDLDSLNTVDRHTVALLAAKYVVSPDAMKIRLSQLGILGPFSDPS